MKAKTYAKAMCGIERFLDRRGIEILDRDWAHGSDKIDFVAEDDGKLVFINTVIRANASKGLGAERLDRESAERIATAWLRDHLDYPEGEVRFDVVTMLVLDDQKALIRHHVNALGIGDFL